jgi:hypothetical protein
MAPSPCMAGDHRLPQLKTQRGLLPKGRAPTPAQKVSFEHKIDLWLSTHRTIDGLWVGSTEDKPWPGLSRVESALRLIKDRDPLHYSRVLRHLDRILVRLIPDAGAHYERQLNACILDRRFVLSETTTVEKVALTIVHETTHARLERWGVIYDEKVRPRIETICIRRELSFASKLPGGEALREDLAASLRWCMSDHDFYSDVRFRERHLQGSLEMLLDLGAPAWFVRIVSKLADRRMAQRAGGGLT